MTEKEQLRQQVEEAWDKYYKFEQDEFSGPGNGCDDYRDIPDDVFKKRRELKEAFEKLKRNFKEQYGHEYNEKEISKEDQFKELYCNWIYSFGVSAFGCGAPEAQEPYGKLREWCKENKEDIIRFIKEILEEEPNDIVMILQDLYAEELGIKIDGYMPLDMWCNMWLNILNKDIKKGKITKDYYKGYRKYKKYLDKHYMSWRPNLENDPNITRKQFEEGQRNGEERRSWHKFPLSILTDEELLKLHETGFIDNRCQMKYIEELQPFYDKVKEELINRGHIL